MKLTITSVDINDFGMYKCVAKNSLGETDGSIKLYRKCPIAISISIPTIIRAGVFVHHESHFLHSSDWYIAGHHVCVSAFSAFRCQIVMWKLEEDFNLIFFERTSRLAKSDKQTISREWNQNPFDNSFQIYLGQQFRLHFRHRQQQRNKRQQLLCHIRAITEKVCVISVWSFYLMLLFIEIMFLNRRQNSRSVRTDAKL